MFGSYLKGNNLLARSKFFKSSSQMKREMNTSMYGLSFLKIHPFPFPKIIVHIFWSLPEALIFKLPDISGLLKISLTNHEIF